MTNILLSFLGALFIVFLMIGLGWRGWVYLRRPRFITDGEDLQAKTDVLMLANIPHFSLDEREIGRIAASLENDEPLPIDDLARNILCLVLSQRESRLLITSPNYGSGKTFVAINLAMYLAGRGEKVLLVDAHPQRSNWHSMLPVCCPVHDDLAGIWKTGVGNLDAVRLRPETVTAGDYLPEQAKAYHYVIFDGPPLPKAKFLLDGKTISHVVLVNAHHVTTQKAFQNTLADLQNCPAGLLGFVMNQPFLKTQKSGEPQTTPPISLSLEEPQEDLSVTLLKARLDVVQRSLTEKSSQLVVALEKIKHQQEVIDHHTEQLSRLESMNGKNLNGHYTNGDQVNGNRSNGNHVLGESGQKNPAGDDVTVYIPIEV